MCQETATGVWQECYSENEKYIMKNSEYKSHMNHWLEIFKYLNGVSGSNEWKKNCLISLKCWIVCVRVCVCT